MFKPFTSLSVHEHISNSSYCKGYSTRNDIDLISLKLLPSSYIYIWLLLTTSKKYVANVIGSLHQNKNKLIG